jgi:hypothetical protein
MEDLQALLETSSDSQREGAKEDFQSPESPGAIIAMLGLATPTKSMD